MHWGLKTAIGIVLIVAGILFMLLEVGVLLIADCGADCVARGERLMVYALIAAGAAVAVAGGFLVRAGLRSRG